MKKILCILSLLISFNSYAESSFTKVIPADIEGYYKDCKFKGNYAYGKSDGLKNNSYMLSNICAEIFETDIKDIKEAYKVYIDDMISGKIKYNPSVYDEDTALIKLLKKELPAKSLKEKNGDYEIEYNIQKDKVDISVTYDNVDYHMVLYKNNGKINIADFMNMYHFLSQTKGYSSQKLTKVRDKIYKGDSVAIEYGKDLYHITSGVTIKNVRTLGGDSPIFLYVLETTNEEEAYKLIKSIALDSYIGEGIVTEEQVKNGSYKDNMGLPEGFRNKKVERYNDKYYRLMDFGFGDFLLMKDKDKTIVFEEIMGY